MDKNADEIASDGSESSDQALDDLFDERLFNIRTAQKVAVWSSRAGLMFLVLLSLSMVATVLDAWERGASAFTVQFPALLTSVISNVLFCIAGYVFFAGLGAGLRLLADIADNSRSMANVVLKENRRGVSK